MQAINIAAYKRLGDSYAEENGEPPEETIENVDVPQNGKVAAKNGYTKLEGNSDSEDGYETAAENDGKGGNSYVESAETGYQRSAAEHDGKGGHGSSCANYQAVSDGGYQSLFDLQTQGYHGYQTQNSLTSLSSQNGGNEVADKCGYFRLEGFSEFCGNLSNLKKTDIESGYSAYTEGTADEKKKLCDGSPEMTSEDVKIEPSPEICGFRSLVKICQMTFCVLALISAMFTDDWMSTLVGIWFALVNLVCVGVISAVLFAQLYRKVDRHCLCTRKLIQLVYLVMVPVLLSAGLLGASVATSTGYRLEFEKTMIMVASMFTLMGLFAVITDVVMSRRTWSMFRMVGGNAYIHAAFMA